MQTKYCCERVVLVLNFGCYPVEIYAQIRWSMRDGVQELFLGHQWGILCLFSRGRSRSMSVASSERLITFFCSHVTASHPFPCGRKKQSISDLGLFCSMSIRKWSPGDFVGDESWHVLMAVSSEYSVDRKFLILSNDKVLQDYSWTHSVCAQTVGMCEKPTPPAGADNAEVGGGSMHEDVPV